MSEPTRREIIDAYKMLERLIAGAYDLSPEEVKKMPSYVTISKFLPPKPRPTMAEVKWDDELHYLAEAEHPGWGKVIMLYKDPYAEAIKTFTKTDDTYYLPSVPLKTLTPTGKKYTLTEVQE